MQRTTVPKSEDVGLLVALKGTVIKSSVQRMLEFKRLVQCAKCGHTFQVEADFEQYYKMILPAKCPNSQGDCPGNTFKTVGKDLNFELCRDYQEIKVQEQVIIFNLT